MKMMKGYLNLCFKKDVLMLADVFKKFTNDSLKNYGLYLSDYLTAPEVAMQWLICHNLSLDLF